MRTPILKGLMHRLILLGTSAKTASWKAHRPYVKEMHCLILKHLPEGQGSAGTLSRDGGAGACHFCTLLHFCLPWDGAPIPPFKRCKMSNWSGVCANMPALVFPAKAYGRACPSLTLYCGSMLPNTVGAFRAYKGCPVSEPRGTYVSGPHRSERIRETVPGRLSLPGQM